MKTATPPPHLLPLSLNIIPYYTETWDVFPSRVILDFPSVGFLVGHKVQLTNFGQKPSVWTNGHKDDGIRTLDEQIPPRRLQNKEIQV